MSLEAIKKQWEKIRTWRDLLHEWQGPPPYGMNALLYQLYQDHQQGQSYAAIEKMLNERMESRLKALLEQNRGLLEAIKDRTIRNVKDFARWQQATESDTTKLFSLQWTLQEYGLSETKINQWCLSVLEDLAEGGNRLGVEVLFTRGWVINKLRTWRVKYRKCLSSDNNDPGRTPNISSQ